MSHSKEMAVRIVLTELQSIQISFRTDITVSQHLEIALEETIQCHSQWRYLKVRYNCITVLRESIRRDITVSQSI